MAKHHPEKPLALEAYEALASRYAAQVDTKPHNAYYERPATLSLLPDVAGKRVMDAGCGPGWYSEWLTERGASVLALDASPRMVELARRRTRQRVEIRQADLNQPLDFLADSSFDLALSALTLDYVEDWHAVFAEFHRILADGGLLVFSVQHPLVEFQLRDGDNYFAVQVTETVWRGFGPPYITVPCYRRPLGAMIEPLTDAGFVIERMIEPQPTPEFRLVDPAGYEELTRRPGFLCFRARKESS
jgi:SAM-dependent methyltransferase